MAVTRSSADAAEVEIVKSVDEADAQTAARIRIHLLQVINARGRLDPAVKAVELLVGSRDTELSDDEKAFVASRLGITVGNGAATNAEPQTLGGAGSTGQGLRMQGNRIVVLDDNERVAGGYLTVEDARADGYTLEVYNDDGSPKGLRRPPKPAPAPEPAPTPTSVDPKERDILLVDRSGNTLNRYIKQGDLDKMPVGDYVVKREAEVDEGGTKKMLPTAVYVKTGLRLGRR